MRLRHRCLFIGAAAVATAACGATPDERASDSTRRSTPTTMAGSGGGGSDGSSTSAMSSAGSGGAAGAGSSGTSSTTTNEPSGGAAGSGPAGGGETRTLSSGTWGGEHAEIRVNADGDAVVEYDCAVGSANGPLKTASDGSFEWQGSFAPERGNPIAPAEVGPQRATYRGTVSGGTMTLAAEVPSLGHTEGPFTLSEGARGFLRKCQ